MAVSAETHDVVGDDDRRSHETPYVQDVGGEYSLIKNPAASELPGLSFGDSNQALHMKVPGTVPAVGRMGHEVEKLRRELRNRTVQELEAALRRQRVILGNRALVARLADRGERSRQSVVAIELLLGERRKEDGLALDMEKLKINTDKMEWKNRLLDSDDDSDPEHEAVSGDPLAVLAQGVVPPSSSRARQTSPSSSLARQTSDLEVFARGQADRVDEVKVGPRFCPHNSVRQAVLDPALRKQLGGGEGREEASPGREDRPNTPNMPLPPLYTCKAQSLSLGDSLRLQQEQEKTLREVQTKHAHARLAAMRQEVVVREEEVEVARFQDYREPGEESDEEEEEDDDEGVGVVGVTGTLEEEQE